MRVPATAPAATTLDAYVATPDPAYKWSVVSTRQEGTLTVTTIEMTSQTWRTADEVDRPEWKHYLTVIRPDTVESDTSLLFIAGGSNDRATPPKTDAMLATFAARTGTIVTELRMIPNQPLTFFKDGVARKEDDLIAYGWRKFLDGGDDQWLARFPMTKAAVRAMDTVQAYAQSPEGGRRAITKFVVSGGSKRGWTTWTTAAVDSRVVAIMPAVIDVLNLRPSMTHHYRAYGFWAPAVGDYVTHGIMDRIDDPRFEKLLALVEPYSYRDRLHHSEVRHQCQRRPVLPAGLLAVLLRRPEGREVPALRAQRRPLAQGHQRTREPARLLWRDRQGSATTEVRLVSGQGRHAS